jgi:hypothetical protein
MAAVTVDAYRNLHKGCISVRKGGRVQKCSQKVALLTPKFVVGAGGRARVLREKRKNVHAFVRGTLTSKGAPRGACKIAVTYDPYKYKTFVTRKGKKPVHGGLYAVVRPGGVTLWRKC